MTSSIEKQNDNDGYNIEKVVISMKKEEEDNCLSTVFEEIIDKAIKEVEEEQKDPKIAKLDGCDQPKKMNEADVCMKEGKEDKDLCSEFEEIIDMAIKANVEEQKDSKLENTEGHNETKKKFSPKEVDRILASMGVCKKCGDLKCCSDCMPDSYDEPKKMEEVDVCMMEWKEDKSLSSEFKEIIDKAVKDIQEEQKDSKMKNTEGHDETKKKFSPKEVDRILASMRVCKKCGDLKCCPDCRPVVSDTDRDQRKVLNQESTWEIIDNVVNKREREDEEKDLDWLPVYKKIISTTT